MRIGQHQIEWLAIAVILGVVVLVFHQANTDMVEQGIAKGGPYNNAAAYPMAVAAFLAGLMALRAFTQIWLRSSADHCLPVRAMYRPAAIIAVFVIYLVVLGWLGFLIATPIMLATLFVLCDVRRPVAVIAPAVLIAFGFAYVFEGWLNIVLPGGVFRLNIAW